MLEPHERIKFLKGEGAFLWLAKAEAWERETGKKAIHFEIGEPDFSTPQNICDAACNAINAGKTKYTTSQGIPELRKAVAEFLGKRRGINIDADNVVIAPGAKCLINASFQCMVNQWAPRAAVILPDPCYGPYRDNAYYVGAKEFNVPLRQEHDWRYDVDVLEKVVKSVPANLDKILVLVSPSNPTGGVLTKEDLKAVAELAERYDLTVVSDEIYDDVVFSEHHEHESIMSIPGMQERTFLIHGASKSWAMTGWRLGWGVVPKRFVPEVSKMIGHTVSCTNTFVQHGGIEAVSGPQDAVDEMVAEYKHRRDYAVKEFQALGCTVAVPMGSFYIFPNVRSWMDKKKCDERQLCERMLQEIGVVCLPGPGFGNMGRDHIRLSLVSSYDDMVEAFDRIEKWLNE